MRCHFICSGSSRPWPQVEGSMQMWAQRSKAPVNRNCDYVKVLGASRSRLCMPGQKRHQRISRARSSRNHRWKVGHRSHLLEDLALRVLGLLWVFVLGLGCLLAAASTQPSPKDASCCSILLNPRSHLQHGNYANHARRTSRILPRRITQTRFALGPLACRLVSCWLPCCY